MHRLGFICLYLGPAFPFLLDLGTPKHDDENNSFNLLNKYLLSTSHTPSTELGVLGIQQ